MKKATSITATDLLRKRGEVLRRCVTDREHFVVETHQVPIVAIIPYDEYREFIAQRE